MLCSRGKNNIYCSYHPNIRFISSRHRVTSSSSIYFFALNIQRIRILQVFKDEYSPSDYLHHLRTFNEKRNVVKFKVSNHKLMIELGRYQRDHILGENRLCPLCKSNQVENKSYFLFQCSRYSVLNRINEIIPDFEKKSTAESIKPLMNSNDHRVNKLVKKLIIIIIILIIIIIII